MSEFRIIEGDCTEGMAAMDGASVDAIVTDPAVLENANRVLARAARRIVAEQMEPETVPAPTWGDRHRREGAPDQVAKLCQRQSVDVSAGQPHRMDEAA